MEKHTNEDRKLEASLNIFSILTQVNKSFSNICSNHFFLLLFAILMIYRCIQSVSLWQNNIYSVKFAQEIIVEDLLVTRLADPPLSHHRASIWLAQQALENGDVEKARKLLKPAIEKNDRFALLTLGYVQVQQGNYSAAIQTWSSFGKYTALIKAAEIAKYKGDHDEALQMYRAAWTINSEKGTIPLATFLKNVDNANAEVALLEKMVTQYPSDSGLHLQWMVKLGDSLRSQKHFNESEIVYRQIIEKYSNSPWGYIGLGWIFYERDGDINRAEQEFLYAIDQDPRDCNGHFNMAKLLASEKRYEEADKWIIQAIQCNPNKPLWHLFRGNWVRFSGDLILAITIYEEMTNLFPDWAPSYYELAWAYKLSNKTEDSILAIEKALVLMPSPNGLYYFRAGKIYEWAGLKSMAKSAYSKATNLMPENETIEMRLERLEEQKTNRREGDGD